MVVPSWLFRTYNTFLLLRFNAISTKQLWSIEQNSGTIFASNHLGLRPVKEVTVGCLYVNQHVLLSSHSDLNLYFDLGIPGATPHPGIQLYQESHLRVLCQ